VRDYIDGKHIVRKNFAPRKFIPSSPLKEFDKKFILGLHANERLSGPTSQVFNLLVDEC